MVQTSLTYAACPHRSPALQQHATSFRVAVAAAVTAAVTTAVPNSPALQRSPAAGPIVQQHCQCILCPALQLDNYPALLPSTPASLASRLANLPHITGQCRGHNRAASITQCSSTVRALCNAGSSRLAVHQGRGIDRLQPLVAPRLLLQQHRRVSRDSRHS